MNMVRMVWQQPCWGAEITTVNDYDKPEALREGKKPHFLRINVGSV